MRTSAGWVLAGSSFVLLVGCELPGRDNPIDPVNAPVARLKVVDRGFPGAGGCPAVDTAFPEIVTASRGRCLALDARDSLSPKDHELGITFVVLDSATKAVLASPPEDGSNEVALLEEYLRTLPYDTRLLAEVSVEDEKLGRTVRARSMFTLENSAPLLVVDRPRTLPLGGYDWAPGQDFVVPFSISGSTDPDGDPLYVEVTVPGQNPVVVGPLLEPVSSPVASPTVPADARGPFTVSMRLFDGPAGAPRAEGRPERAVVRVHEPSPWIQRGAGSFTSIFGTTSRIDGTRLNWNDPLIAISEAADPAGLGGITRRGSEPVLVTRSNPGPIRTLSWPDGQETGTFAVSGDGFRAALAVGANGEIWRVSPSDPRIQRLQVADGDVTVGLVDEIAGDPAWFPLSTSIDAAVSANASVWAAQLGNDGYLHASETGGIVTATTHDLPGRSVVDLAARPSSNEVWMLDTDVVGGDPVLRQLTAPGVMAQTWSIESESATALAWAGADSLWLAHGTLGLLRLDARLLDAGIQTLEAAVLDQFPVYGISGIVADAESGTAWAHSLALDSSWRVDTNGHLDAIGSAHKFFDVDPDGAALFGARPAVGSGSSVPARASSTLGGGRDRTMPFSILPGGANDPTTGGAWLYRSTGEIVHVDEEGNQLARRRYISLPGGAPPEPLPRLAAFRPSPDGSHAWAIELAGDNTAGAVYHLDLRTEPMTATIAIADADDIDPVGFDPVMVGRPNFPILEPSSPDGETAWFVRFENSAPDSAAVMILSTGGTVTPLPSSAGVLLERALGGVVVRAAVSQKSNTLCLAAVAGAANELHVRRLHLDGTVEDFLTAEPFPDPMRLIAVATSSTETEDFCWVMWKRSPDGDFEIRAFADPDDAVPARTLSGPAGLEPLALIPFRGDTVWVSTKRDFAANDDAFLSRYDFLPGSVVRESALGLLREASPQDGPAFLSPAAPIQRYSP